MTLILIGMNSRFAVQVSDRRLTAGSTVVEEEHNKSFTLSVPGFRFMFAYTGIARVNGFRTAEWIFDKVRSFVQINRAPQDVVNKLRDALNYEFSNNINLKYMVVGKKRLDICITGYNYTTPEPVGLAATVSNFGDISGTFHSEFSGATWPNDGTWTWVGAFGNYVAWKPEYESQMRKALSSSISPDNYVSILENIIRKMADSPLSNGGIGKQLDRIILYKDYSISTLGTRSSMTPLNDATMTAAITAGSDGSVLAVKDMVIKSIGQDAHPMTVPKVHRNAPCPCGKGIKYRLCHGKAVPPHPPALP